ncbi:nuclease-related domain-containing protein [Pseudoneobacillus sp. C159]
MPFKARTEPKILLKLRILNARMKLSEEDQLNFYNQEKGFQGEIQFDCLTEQLLQNGHIINDLLIRNRNSEECQIDTSIIFYDTINLFDVKNFEGEFSYSEEKLHKVSGRDYKNPLGQLYRAKTLFQQQLDQLGCKLKVEAYVVFINPQFTLFNVPQGLPFILPTQIPSFMKKLTNKPAKLNSQHRKLAEMLVSLHQTESLVSPQLPPFSFGGMKKGFSCEKCFCLTVMVDGRKVVCGNCSFEETVESAVLRSVGEIKLLFPELKITSNLVFEWCGGVVNDRKVSRILAKNFKMNGIKRWAYFE